MYITPVFSMQGFQNYSPLWQPTTLIYFLSWYKKSASSERYSVANHRYTAKVFWYRIKIFTQVPQTKWDIYWYKCKTTKIVVGFRECFLFAYKLFTKLVAKLVQVMCNTKLVWCNWHLQSIQTVDCFPYYLLEVSSLTAHEIDIIQTYMDEIYQHAFLVSAIWDAQAF